MRMRGLASRNAWYSRLTGLHLGLQKKKTIPMKLKGKKKNITTKILIS